MEDSEKLEMMHPDKVMKIHRFKVKRDALQARMNRSVVGNSTALLNSKRQFQNEAKLSNNRSPKRKNPFVKNESNKKLKDSKPPDLEASSDSTLFELLNFKPLATTTTGNLNKKEKLSFDSVLTELDYPNSLPEQEALKGEKYIPIDWTLHSKMRLMSEKPFPWNVKLKISEEASSTSGFVRCLDIGEKETTLDTSPNAR